MWNVECQDCRHARWLWVKHHLKDGKVSCGTEILVSSEQTEKLDDVNCLDCLSPCWSPLGPKWSVPRQRCGACGGEHRLSQSLWNSPWGREFVRSLCAGCGESTIAGRPLHRERADSNTYCGVGADHVNRLVDKGPADLACGACLQAMFAEDPKLLPVPDWRPEILVAEDYYAR
jgi:hypothetical protein